MPDLPTYAVSFSSPEVKDFNQLLAEAVIVLANHVGLQNQPGFQDLLKAAYHRQQALNAGTIRVVQ